MEIDIVLTDIRMPEIDGTELSHRIRNQSPCTKIAVMFGGDADVATELMNNGTVDYRSGRLTFSGKADPHVPNGKSSFSIGRYIINRLLQLTVFAAASIESGVRRLLFFER